jgi:hypothetical protein
LGEAFGDAMIVFFCCVICGTVLQTSNIIHDGVLEPEKCANAWHQMILISAVVVSTSRNPVAMQTKARHDPPMKIDHERKRGS